MAPHSELDPEKYGTLLASALPAVIETIEDHERLLTLAETLMEKGSDALSLEERKLLELLVLLIEVFERQVEEAEPDEESADAPPSPHESLKRLLDARGWESGVLNDIFGNPKLTAEALSGGRPLTKGQAKALGQLFRVPPKLFLSD